MDVSLKVALLLLAILVCTASIAAASERAPQAGGESLLATLRPSHPRLLATDDEFARLAQLVREDATAGRWFSEISAAANGLLSRAPSRYEIPDGLRLLGVSRQVLDRIYHLALAYRLTGDERYSARAWAELEAAAQFPDWNPRHFLDTAEMTHAFAVGYDWLYDAWTPEQREVLRRAIVEKGLLPALESYRGARGDWNRHGWVTTEINWNLVVNGGIALGALAVAEEEPELAEEIVRASLDSIRHSIGRFAPDGGWDEGVSYWAYSVRYLVTYLAGLHSALGTEFGLAEVPGISETGYFPIYMTGPSGIPYNFSDSWTDLQAPELLWLAGRFDRPEYAWWFQGPGGARGDARRLLWYQKGLAERFEAGELPLDRSFGGVETATMRSAWNDRNAVFAGFRAGDNRAGHAHLDKGSFVLEAEGVRWAVDLGPDDYNLPGYFSGGAVDLYRIRAEGHNTLVINPGSGPDQIQTEAAAIEFFRSTPGEAAAIADLTPVYRNDAVSVKRGVALFNERKQVLVQDEWTLRAPGEVWWFMHTQAAVSVEGDGRTAILSQNGKRLAARILSPEGARFTVMDARPLPGSPDPPGQARNENVRKLAIRFEGSTTERVAVLLTPLPLGEAVFLEPDIAPLEAWKAAGGAPLWPPTPEIRVDVESPSGGEPVHGLVPLIIELEAPGGIDPGMSESAGVEPPAGVRVEPPPGTGVEPPAGTRVEAPAGLRFERVDVKLSGRTVYSGPGAPQDAVIDTRAFPDGEHTLTVEARIAGGAAAAYFSRVVIENAWRLVDEFEPPLNMGFFGVLDRSKTSEASEGWTYVKGDYRLFGGDDTRMALEAPEGYLVWEAPNVEAFRLRLFATGEAIGDLIEFAASADGEAWERLEFEIALVESSGGWRTFELSGAPEEGAGFRRFRLTMKDGDPASMQLGRLELSGTK